MTETFLTGCVLCVGDERRGAEGVDPVVVPQRVQQPLIHDRLEVGHLQRVVGLAVHAEVFDLAQGDCLVLAGTVIRRFIACLRIVLTINGGK
jgi:hypothetical protein